MGYKIQETTTAVQDYNNIISYLTSELSNPSAALAFADAVDECYFYLTQTPEMYELCRRPTRRLMGIRRAVIKRYVMIYQIDEAAKCVRILRFFHGKQNYERYL